MPPAGSSEPVVDVAVTASEPEGEEPESLPVREMTVEVDGQSYAVRIIGGVDSGATAVAAPAAPVKATVREGTVVSPMQGLLLKVNVKVGDHVALGDVVCVLEAMKMQNDITATRAGTVTEVYVTEGMVVSPRAPLIQIGA
jgi:biotin carboxyl carrier protein